MANPRVDRLDQKFASLMDMFEGLMKKMEENNTNFHSILLKKLLDAQKNEIQCPQHPKNPVAQNIPHHCVVKATPASASKSKQNGVHYQYGSRRE
jgi:hypothetical protein